MDVKAAIASRRSIRKYVKKTIPKGILNELLESMRLAPSASNKQRWKMIVVTDPRIRKKLVAASGNQKFVGECSAYVVGVAEPGAYYSAVDMTIAMDHLTLRAVELGLGTCWIGDFEPDQMKRILGIPKEREVVICLTLGYPNEDPRPRKRKNPSELFHLDGWNRRWG